MRRRAFVSGTLALLAAPLAARAQQPGKLPTIGFVGTNTASAQSQWTAAFVQRLRELGWIEGRTVMIEYRWAEGRSERFGEIVTELVRLKVDVIVTHSAVPVLEAKKATSVIPIVFAVSDPLGTGLVRSLARPGGNATGLSLQQTEATGRRLELLRDVVPGLRRLARWRRRRAVRAMARDFHVPWPSSIMPRNSGWSFPPICLYRAMRL